MNDNEHKSPAESGIDRDQQRRVERGSRRLGWLIGPAIIVATLLVASGCDAPLLPPATIGESR